MKMYRTQRLRRGMTQMQLSELTGISQARISRFENKLITLTDSEREALATALSMSASTQGHISH